jgi:streptogramin lyase
METSRGYLSAFFFAVAMGSLAACAGGTGTLVPRPPIAAAPTSKPGSTAVVRFSLTIPKASSSAHLRRPDYVSMGTNSAAIVVTGPSPSASAEPAVTLDCTSGQTCSTSVVAPIGSDSFAVSLYGGQNRSGSLLGLGTTTQSIVGGQDNTIDVTLNGVVNSVSLTTSPSVLPAGTPATESVTINALDASGDTIIAPGGYVDASGNPLTISVTKSDYGKGKGETIASPSPAPVATGPGTTAANGTTQTYNYTGNDLDETLYTSTTSSAILGSQGTAKVDYTPTFVKKYADTAEADTNFITTGPDGNLWFTDFGTSAIGLIAPSTGAITHFTVTSATSSTNGAPEPEGIVAGPNSTMYFADFSSNAIGAISTTAVALTGTATPITETPLTTTNANPRGIAYNTACDANIWFTEYNGDKIGTLSATTSNVTEYDIPTAAAQPDQIVCGPDGNFWFTEYAANKVGTIVPSTGAITEYPFPNPSGAHGPIGIAAGADGSMWVAEALGNAIARVATKSSTPAGSAVGSIVEYPLAGNVGSPGGTSMYPSIIASAPDGDLFYSLFNSETQAVNAMIGRITTTGAVAPDQTPNVLTSYPLDNTANMPYGITVGPDGHIWYVEMGSGQIGYVVY